MHKKFLALVFHGIFTKILNKITNINRSIVLVFCRYVDPVLAFVVEEHLQASPEEVSESVALCLA
jgi:hypothetical protein